MMNMQNRQEMINEIVKKIQDSGVDFKDIRYRNWLNSNGVAAEVLAAFIYLENLLMNLDEYQMENNQIFPYIEDFVLQVGDLRDKFTNYVDSNQELLSVKLK